MCAAFVAKNIPNSKVTKLVMWTGYPDPETFWNFLDQRIPVPRNPKLQDILEQKILVQERSGVS